MLLFSGNSAAAFEPADLEHQNPPQDLHPLIVGGEKVTSRNDYVYKHTSRLLIKGEIQSGPGVPREHAGLSFSWRCSATLVAQDALVTAAHCMPERIYLKGPSNQFYWAPLSILSIEAFFEFSPRQDPFWGEQHSHYVRHPGFQDNWVLTTANVWNPQTAINDIAVVFLRGSAPPDKSPVTLPKAGAMFERSTLTLAGYGRSDPSNTIEIPELRKVQVPFIESLQNGADFFAGFGNIKRPNAVANPRGACSGDSGGPAYNTDPATNQVTLAGIIVRGPSNNNGGCESSITIATDLRSYLPWLDSVLDNSPNE
jgi:hypothetical protein